MQAAEEMYNMERNGDYSDLPKLNIAVHPDQLKFIYDLKSDVNDFFAVHNIQYSNTFDKGQKVLKAVWARKVTLAKKINKKIIKYNTAMNNLPYDQLVATEVFNLNSTMWEGLLENSVFKSIDTYCTLLRVKEEVELLKNEQELLLLHIEQEIARVTRLGNSKDNTIPINVLHNWIYHLKCIVVTAYPNHLVDFARDINFSELFLNQNKDIVQEQDEFNNFDLSNDYDLDDDLEVTEGNNDWSWYGEQNDLID
jgi:hypothetical protein